jgi:hypothetical protein
VTTAPDISVRESTSREIGSERRPRSKWSRGNRRKTLLTIHIASAVALLGSTAGFLVLAVRAATRGDQPEAHALYEAVGQLPLFLGIPLSFIALISGVLVGLTSTWGVFRHWWVTGKLALLVGVILLGALLNTRTVDTMLETTAPGADGKNPAEWSPRRDARRADRDGARSDGAGGVQARRAHPPRRARATQGKGIVMAAAVEVSA